MQDLVTEAAVQQWLRIEEDKYVLELTVKDTAYAKRLFDPEGEPMLVDQHIAYDTKKETLKL